MKFTLLQARLSEDPVREEERQAFACQMGIDIHQIVPFDMLTEVPDVARVTSGVDAVLVGGSGAFSVLDEAPWIQQFIHTLGSLADSGFPTFASCFGFQAMVLALGGTIAHDEENAEVGSFILRSTQGAQQDPVFGILPTQFIAQEGHKDRATTLPSSVINLAASDRCPYQAIRIPGKPVYATQFHPELTSEGNRKRFARYFDMYSQAFGQSQAESMMEAFQPSPETNELLKRFVTHISS